MPPLFAGHAGRAQEVRAGEPVGQPCAQVPPHVLGVINLRGKVIDVSEKTFVIEVTGSGDKIDAFEKQMESFGVRELVRTGRIAMMRGPRRAGARNGASIRWCATFAMSR